MTPKIEPRGKSFAGLATYLTRDPKAKTEERVAWTHTLNLANEHVPSAVDEMLWTARAAELLKQEAGIRAGGRMTENTVKHVSLNWSPEDDPSKAHMIETAEGFLRHMSWNEHQTLIVAHDDKAHAHVHLMINAIHPETGLRLDEGFEHRRAQAWALGYEREQGRIYCEQRLLNAAEREEAPTRPVWMAFKDKQQEFENAEKALRAQEPILISDPENPKMDASTEWKMLKDLQRQERMGFFAEGKSAFSEMRGSVSREVREEFRERWSDFYAAQREGGDPKDFAEFKAALLAEQKETLEKRRDEACAELRKERDGIYRELLDDQREARLGLRWRQEAGLDNAIFFDALESKRVGKDLAVGFRETADDLTRPTAAGMALRPMQPDEPDHMPERNSAGMRSGADVSANVALGVGFAFASFFDFFADGLVHSNPGPRREPEPPPPKSKGPDLFEAAANEVRRQSEQREATEEEEKRRRQRGGYWE